MKEFFEAYSLSYIDNRASFRLRFIKQNHESLKFCVIVRLRCANNDYMFRVNGDIYSYEKNFDKTETYKQTLIKMKLKFVLINKINQQNVDIIILMNS